MIKVFCFLTAHATATDADVREALRHVGAPITPGIRHEVRSLPLTRGTDSAGWAFGDAFGHAAVIELWLDDPAEWQLARAHIDGEIKDVLGDVCDAAHTTYLATRETVVVANPVDYGSQPVKALFFPRRKPGTSVGQFGQHWATTHAAIVPHTPGLRRYVQCHTLAEEYLTEARPAYDGVAELWWNTRAEMVKALESTAFTEEQPADAALFVDPDSLVGFAATEVRVK